MSKHFSLRRACLALVLSVVGALSQLAAAELTIRNGTFWKDSSGTPIYSQGGGILKIGAKYYWYGVKYAEAVKYAQAPGAFADRSNFSAVTAYSSHDLVNWSFEGDVLQPAGLAPHAAQDAWVGRMGVVYNKRTRKYVLIIQYAGDRWSNFAGNGLGYNIWVPLSFRGAEPVFNSLSEFRLDASKGTWSVGKGNNYILNPGFEADRVRQTGVAGWVSSWTSLKGDAPFVNTRDSRSGRWALLLRHPGETMGSAVQDIALPNGIYTLRAWVRSSGAQGVARLYASGHGGAEIVRDLREPTGEWREVTLPGIKVDTGGVQIGVYSEGKEGDWLGLDDLSLVRD